jgi:hypothetical protein
MTGSLSVADSKLLLRLAETRDNPAAYAAIEAALRVQPDWGRILKLAQWHGISPLVWSNLRRLPADLIPESVRGRLEAQFQHALARHDVLTRALLRILDQFSDRGIRAISFKGPALAAHLYSGIAPRESSDLDILIAPDEFPLAVELLKALGYSSPKNMSAYQTACYMRAGSEMEFADAAGVAVDLHVRLGPAWLRAPFDHDSLWPRVIEVPLGGATVRSLNDDDLLLYLCYHGGKSLWNGLKWLCDVDRLVRVGRVEWSELESRAVAHRCWKSVRLGLLLASEGLGAPAPPSIVESARSDRAVRYLARRAAGRWFLMDPRPGPLQPLVLCGLADTAWSRFRGLARLVTAHSTADVSSVALPRGLSSLYSVLRPFRLAWKYSVGRALPKTPPAPPQQPLQQTGQITPESIIVRNGDFSASRIGGTLVIMNPVNERSFALDETAALVWELLENPVRVSTACASVREARAEKQTLEFLRRLAEERAVKLASTGEASSAMRA